MIAFIASAMLVFAADANAAQASTSAADDKTRMVCKREHVVGSNRPKKVCLTKAQWDELEERAERAQNRSNATQDLSRANPGGR